MVLLVIVSLVWAFSFGLIGNRLAGLPPAWLAWVRLALSALVFLPFVRRLPWKAGLALFATGAVQFGLMYFAYMTSFRYLQSHEVALFTVVTPLFVAGLDDLFGRKFRPWHLLAAMLAVAGAGLIKWQSVQTVAPLKGILLVQVSNLCFAAGQLAYRAVMARLPRPVSDHQVFFWLHFGGFAVLTPLAWPLARAAAAPILTLTQWAILAYLGVIASGVCFFLWNRGARFVNAGQLAVMNNLKIPLAVGVSLFFFRESAGLATFLAGALLILVALLPAQKSAA